MEQEALITTFPPAEHPGERLTDVVITASSILVKEQFPDLDGFQLTNYSETENRFSPVETDSIQFHFFNNHWVTSQLVDEKVIVYDSNFTQAVGIPPTLQKQLKEIYRSQIQEETLRVDIAPVQQQRGVSDCGVFAIAFAISLAYGDQPQTQLYTQSKMRKHLVDCLDSHYFTPFQSLHKRTRSHDESITCLI